MESGYLSSRRRRSGRRGLAALLVGTLVAVGCESAAPRAPALAAQEALPVDAFASLVDRISEAGGYFDTDNLISNETGYLNVLDALAARALGGGAYIGVGPDQSFSYIAELRPSIAFIVDVRRDNMLHHLLLKALIEASPTRVEFLARLHGAPAPPSPTEWREADVREIVAYVDSARAARSTDDAGASERAALVEEIRDSVARRLDGYGIPLTEDDHATIRRFHRTFVEAGPSLRFTSFGRAPRPYYPTYRELLLETDVDGDRVSYLSSAERYDVVRDLELANRIVPVVGDLAGPHAVREIGDVLTEMGIELDAFYASNVEFYLWRDRTFDRWVDNLRTLPASDEAVVIRSYFPNFGGGHPSAVRGYYATQSLQSVSTLTGGRFDSYWDVVTRDVIPLR